MFLKHGTDGRDAYAQTVDVFYMAVITFGEYGLLTPTDAANIILQQHFRLYSNLSSQLFEYISGLYLQPRATSLLLKLCKAKI